MQNQKELVKGLGFFALVASCFNCTVGGGIFRLPSSVFAIAGNLAPVVYFVCFLVMLFVAGVFIQVGRKVRTSGGPYAYVKPILGDYPGFICGVLLWFLATFAFASVSNAYAHFVALLIPGMATPMGEAFILGISLLILAFLNTLGVKSGAKVVLILAMIKILPLGLLFFAGIPHLNHEALALPTHWDGSIIARGAMLLIFAFTGIESALIPSGEIESPEKNLPRALIFSSFLVLTLYLGVQFVSQSVLGQSLGEQGISPLALTAEKIMGSIGGTILGFGAVFSTLGYLSAMTLSLPRSLMAFSEDGYLPKKLSFLSEKSNVPLIAIWTQVIIVYLLAVSSQFEKLAILANLSAILMYILCAVAAIMLMKRSDNFRIRNLFIPVGAFIMMGFLLTSVTQDEWISVMALLAASSLIYMKKKKANP